MAAVGGPSELFKVQESTQNNFYTCSDKSLDSRECQVTFARENGFAIVSTPKRGDCMYYALTYFGDICDVPQLKKNNMRLRQELVDKLLQTDYTSLGLKKKHILELHKKGKYDCLAGELPPAFIASVFGLHVKIYRYDDAAKKITLNRYDVVGGNGLPTVHLLHSHSHYRLLVSQDQMTDQVEAKLRKYSVNGFKVHLRRTTHKNPSNNSNMESNSEANNGNSNRNATLERKLEGHTIPQLKELMILLYIELPKKVTKKADIISFILSHNNTILSSALNMYRMNIGKNKTKKSKSSLENIFAKVTLGEKLTSDEQKRLESMN